MMLRAAPLAAIWLAGTAIFFMSLIIPWGVFTRYMLGTGSQWPEPIAILLMMAFTFVGGAAARRFAEQGHDVRAMSRSRLMPGKTRTADFISSNLAQHFDPVVLDHRIG